MVATFFFFLFFQAIVLNDVCLVVRVRVRVGGGVQQEGRKERRNQTPSLLILPLCMLNHFPPCTFNIIFVNII